MTEARSPGELRGDASPAFASIGDGAALLVQQPLTEVGETFSIRVQFTDDDVITIARQLHDLNPFHHDIEAARAAGYPGLIASGAHTGAIFMGMTATHFSKPAPSGLARSVLGLGFDIRFRAVVFAHEEITMRWTVATSVWKASLNGFVTQATGDVRTPRGIALTGTANLLLRRA